MRALVFAMFVAIQCASSTAVAMETASNCRVLDPELQGEYSGPCVDGLAQGEGRAKGSALYTGAFVAGRKHGVGVKEWANGDRYAGEFREDRKHGYGNYTWGRGSEWAGQRYSGAYVEDRRHGAGVYAWPDGREIAGRWHFDQPPPVLSPVLQTTVRAHAERLAALAQPGARVCRETQIGVVQRDIVVGVVQGTSGDRVRILIERAGRFSNQLDDRVIAPGDEVVVYPDQWFACR